MPIRILKSKNQILKILKNARRHPNPFKYCDRYFKSRAEHLISIINLGLPAKKEIE
jgi:hypothetical protein